MPAGGGPVTIVAGNGSEGECGDGGPATEGCLVAGRVVPDGERFVPLEQVIAAHLGQLFPGMEVESTATFRVSRNADLTLEEEEAEDLLAAVEIELRRRQFGRAVRLEISEETTDEVRELLQAVW